MIADRPASNDVEVFGPRLVPRSDSSRADPVTTEIIRHALNSAAQQMKRVLMRTAFSPIIYEGFDFATAICDPSYRTLGQALGLPTFMGTLGFCVQDAVEAVGGEHELAPGDILLSNWPYGTGSHANDAVTVMPIFLPGKELIGYAAIKAHWLDVGQKEFYVTNTTDVYQEGTFFPGVKLYRGGEIDSDLYRVVLANSRLPKVLAGDLAAGVAGVRAAAAAMVELVERYGLSTFEICVERMLDHGEALVRSYFQQLPDGRYTAWGQLDDDGIGNDPVRFEIAVEIDGSDCTVDFSGVPDSTLGPFNCPIGSTISTSRVAISLLAGGGEEPNEGHFRPVKVLARRGSLYHPQAPSPCFMCGYAIMQALEVIFAAVAQATPAGIPAWSGGDACLIMWWGTRERSGEPWGAGQIQPVGQGAHDGGDGPSSLLHWAGAASRVTPIEVMESKYPWVVRQFELAADSGGAGRHRGGLGVDVVFDHAEECLATTLVERTKTLPWGLEGGLPGRTNALDLVHPDGRREPLAKRTAIPLAKGSRLEMRSGGGGGYGTPSERDIDAVRRDLREGYVTESYAREHYPHAFSTEAEPQPIKNQFTEQGGNQ